MVANNYWQKWKREFLTYSSTKLKRVRLFASLMSKPSLCARIGNSKRLPEIVCIYGWNNFTG